MMTHDADVTEDSAQLSVSREPAVRDARDWTGRGYIYLDVNITNITPIPGNQ